MHISNQAKKANGLFCDPYQAQLLQFKPVNETQQPVKLDVQAEIDREKRLEQKASRELWMGFEMLLHAACNPSPSPDI